jgi:hypothetical protein
MNEKIQGRKEKKRYIKCKDQGMKRYNNVIFTYDMIVYVKNLRTIHKFSEFSKVAA